MNRPSENELIVAGYFNVGLATEAHGAKAKLYKMDWAGTSGSGVSVGVAQHDFYAHRGNPNDSKGFVQAYNQWAVGHGHPVYSGGDLEHAASALRNTVGSGLQAPYKSNFDAFLDQPAGQNYVFKAYDVARYRQNAQTILEIYDNSPYLQAIPQDKANQAMAMLTKFANQGGLGEIDYFFKNKFFDAANPRSVAGVSLNHEDLQHPERIFDKLEQVFKNASHTSVREGNKTIVTLEGKDALKAATWAQEVWQKFDTPQFASTKQYLVETLDISGANAPAEIKPRIDVMRSLYRDFDFHLAKVDLNGSAQPFTMTNDGLGHSIKFNGQTNEFSIKYRDGSEINSTSLNKQQQSFNDVTFRAQLHPELTKTAQTLIADATHHTQKWVADNGLQWNEQFNQAAHSVARAAHEKGMTGINLFAVNGGQIDFGHKEGFMLKTGSVETAVASNTNIAQSLQAMSDIDRTQNQAQSHAQQQAHVQTNERSGPRMG